MEPLGTEDFFFRGLVRIVVHEIGHHIVFLLLFGKETVVVLPVVLIHADVEGPTLTNSIQIALLRYSLVLLMLQVHRIIIGHPLVVTKEATTGQSSYLGGGVAPDQISVLLFVHHFGNGIWQQISR